MACTVTPANLYAELECYGINASVLSHAWIEAKRDQFIVPWVERKTRIPVSTSTRQYTDEFYSGTGSSILMLRRRFISSVDSLQLVNGGDFSANLNVGALEIISREGILKSRRNFDESAGPAYFPRGNDNIKISYTVSVPSDIQDALCHAVKCFLAEKALGSIASRTGGGDLSIQSFSRQFGRRGRWSHIRNDYAREGMASIKDFFLHDSGQ